MIDWGTYVAVTISVLVTYIGIKIINRLFDKTEVKKKNSLF